MTDLLPRNSTPLERAICQALDTASTIPTPAGLMWDPQRIPAAYLPWLAWAVSVDDWSPDWAEEDKRLEIAGSAAWHRIKGTRQSVQMVLDRLGFTNAVIVEDREMPRYGRGVTYGRAWVYGPTDPSWADYWIEIPHPVWRADAERLADRLAATAPARCRLRTIRATGAGRHVYGRAWTYGSAATYGSTYHMNGARNG